MCTITSQSGITYKGMRSDSGLLLESGVAVDDSVAGSVLRSRATSVRGVGNRYMTGLCLSGPVLPSGGFYTRLDSSALVTDYHMLGVADKDHILIQSFVDAADVPDSVAVDTTSDLVGVDDGSVHDFVGLSDEVVKPSGIVDCIQFGKSSYAGYSAKLGAVLDALDVSNGLSRFDGFVSDEFDYEGIGEFWRGVDSVADTAVALVDLSEYRLPSYDFDYRVRCGINKFCGNCGKCCFGFRSYDKGLLKNFSLGRIPVRVGCARCSVISGFVSPNDRWYGFGDLSRFIPFGGFFDRLCIHCKRSFGTNYSDVVKVVDLYSRVVLNIARDFSSAIFDCYCPTLRDCRCRNKCINLFREHFNVSGIGSSYWVFFVNLVYEDAAGKDVFFAWRHNKLFRTSVTKLFARTDFISYNSVIYDLDSNLCFYNVDYDSYNE